VSNCGNRGGARFRSSLHGYTTDVRPDIANELARLADEERREAEWRAIAVAAIDTARATRRRRRTHGPGLRARVRRRAA
jgi:hypothetical protein